MPVDYQLELRQLRYFIAVAENLHFRKAAEQLFISQPGLSRQIQQLEENIGVTLFERHNRKVELTTAGSYLYNEVDILLKNLKSIIHHTQLVDTGHEGNLRLGYVGSAMHSTIPKMFLTIREHYPKVLFDLKEMDNKEQIKGLLSFDIDLGFVRLERVPKQLELLPLFTETFSLVLPIDHHITEENFKGLSELVDEKFILFDPSYSESYYEKVMRLFDEAGFAPQIAHQTIHASSIYRLVENNFGVSIVPSSLQSGYDMNVKFIELKQTTERTTLSLVWNQENRNPILSLILRLFQSQE